LKKENKEVGELRKKLSDAEDKIKGFEKKMMVRIKNI